MRRRPTIHEARGIPPPGVAELAAIWDQALIVNLLSAVWDAFDDIHATLLSKITWPGDYRDLERAITEELDLAIQRKLNAYLPVQVVPGDSRTAPRPKIQVQHGPYERERRKEGGGQTDEYDIAFVWTADIRVKWPLDAKVLKSDTESITNLGDYRKTFAEKFLACRYGPFANGGAMLAYLVQGDGETLISSLSQFLEIEMEQHPAFPSRTHKISAHLREVPPEAEYPKSFTCHHLVMPLG